MAQQKEDYSHFSPGTRMIIESFDEQDRANAALAPFILIPVIILGIVGGIIVWAAFPPF